MKKQNLVRVTAVLDFVESKWKEYWWRKVGFEAADKISRESAAFGTAVHNLIGAALTQIPMEPESEEQALCANVVLEYLKHRDVQPLFESYEKSLEIEVSDKKLGLIGHFDFAALVDGIPTIVDFKTSNQMRKSFPLQKAAYAKMCNKMFGTDIQKGLTIRAHWDKEKQKVEFEDKEYENLIKDFWPKFNDCLSVWTYFNRSEK